MEAAKSSIVIGIFTDLRRATKAVEQLCMAQFHHCTQCNAKMYIGSELTINPVTAQELLDTLTSTLESQEELRYYSKELMKRNRIIVVVKPSERVNEARDILLRQGAYDATTHSPCHLPEAAMNIHGGLYNPNIPQGTGL